MLLASVLSHFLTLSLIPIASLASPVPIDEFDVEDDVQNLLEPRQSGFTVVRGVRSGVQPRLEVRQMHDQYPDQWNLYLLALQHFQNTNQDRKLSLYQIAGIHGVPNIPWDGVQANPDAQGGVGYCTHDSVLFPGWHRPFLALFEQVLMAHVKVVVQTFPAGPNRKKYAAAAKTMRAPFWDSAAAPPYGSTFPTFFSDQYVSVTTSTGQQSINNPLYQYTFHPLNSGDMLFSPWANWPKSLRWPTSESADATSQNSKAQDAVETSRINRRDDLYNMFVNCNDYLGMSNDAAGSASPGCGTSLEYIHNGIHALVGGQNKGHMSYLWWSSFDPVFFLHHMNVDRLFAMWQAVHPDSYGAYQNAPGATFTIAQGSQQGPNSPLTPFHADTSGTFWTTNTVRDWTTFGYTYPEFAHSDGSSSSIRNYINKLYGPSASATAGSSKVKRHLDLDLSQPLSKDLLRKTTTASGATYQYIANVATPRFALNGSYNVYLFMGGPTNDNDASGWLFDQNLIGSVNIFSQPGMQRNKLITSGSVPLTRALTSVLAGGIPVMGEVLKDMDKSSAVPFLQKVLHWRVATSTNEIIDPDNIPGFEVSVVTSEAQPPVSQNEFPKYSSFLTLPDITHGKKGGLNIGDLPACERIS